ncbi:MAG: hypothetical protein QF757_05765 [Candidatus Marinimicrobia bacterium]|nr:hypothetical protein [Candidatus Neomarinimicrobiota bacterium]
MSRLYLGIVLPDNAKETDHLAHILGVLGDKEGVVAAIDFNIDMGHAEVFHLSDPGASACDKAVLSALQHDDGNVPDGQEPYSLRDVSPSGT